MTQTSIGQEVAWHWVDSTLTHVPEYFVLFTKEMNILVVRESEERLSYCRPGEHFRSCSRKPGGRNYAFVLVKDSKSTIISSPINGLHDSNTSMYWSAFEVLTIPSVSNNQSIHSREITCCTVGRDIRVFCQARVNWEGIGFCQEFWGAATCRQQPEEMCLRWRWNSFD